MMILDVTIANVALPTIRLSRITVDGSYTVPGILMAVGLGMTSCR